MDRPKYTRWEHERRFLVKADDVRFLSERSHSRLVEDRYLSCGRLRLRKLTDSDTGAVTFKLTKKYESASAHSQPIVTILLSSEEYAGLLVLPGSVLQKRRFYEDVDGRIFGVDVFEGPLSGLVLCSIETDTREELDRVALPRYAGQEVTQDPLFSGGCLCRITTSELERAVANVYRASV